MHSATASLDSIRKYLSIIADRAPNTIPIINDKIERMKKSKMIVKLVPTVISLSELAITELKMMIVTMSFTTPSPKSRLNSFGYSL